MLLDASIPARHPAAVAGCIAGRRATAALPASSVQGRFVARAEGDAATGPSDFPAVPPARRRGWPYRRRAVAAWQARAGLPFRERGT
jgi:hypothetical protein